MTTRTLLSSAVFLLSLLASANASAFSRRLCETGDQATSIDMLFDAADNYFVMGTLTAGGEKIAATLLSPSRIRPRPEIDPNRPLLTLGFGSARFVLSLDAGSATLTGADGSVEAMICCPELGIQGEHCPSGQ